MTTLNPAFDYGQLFKAPIEERQAILDSAKKPGLGKTLAAAANSEWTLSWMARSLSNISNSVPDPGFDVMEKETFALLTEDLAPEYWGELGHASSLRHALSIRDGLRSVQQSRETLARAGVGGVVATLGAAILDPAIIAGAFGAGAMVAKAGRAASATQNFIRGGAAGLAVDVPAEAFLVSQDPDRGTSDILLAGLASFTLGGLGEAAVGGLANRAVRADRGSIEYVAGAAVPKGSRPKSVAESVRDATPEAKRAIRTRLQDGLGLTDAQVDEALADPEIADGLLSKLAGDGPPESVNLAGFSGIDFSRASSAPAAFSRARRSMISFLADKRFEGKPGGDVLLFIGNVIAGDPLAKKGGAKSVLAADEAQDALYQSRLGDLNRPYRKAWINYQAARKEGNSPIGLREYWQELQDFGRMVIEEIERPGTHGVGEADKAGRAVREAAESSKKWYDEWLDAAAESGLIDGDDLAALKENTNYFPRVPLAKKFSEFARVHGKKGKRALVETVANAHRVANGVDDATYNKARDIEGALGTNFRFVLAGMVEVDGEDAARKFVSERLTQTGRFSTDEVAEIAALGAEPEALYEEWVDAYRGAMNLARMYTETVRGIGRLSDADSFRLFQGKQLENLRRVLAQEKWANEEFTDENIEAIIKAVSETAADSETGKPTNFRYRTPLDGYAQFDASEILGESVEPMTVNDFSDRNFWRVSDRYARSVSGSMTMRKVFDAVGERTGSEIHTVPQFLSRYEQLLADSGHDPRFDKLGKAAYIRMEAMLNDITSTPHKQGAVSQAMGQQARIWRKFMNTVRNGSFAFAALPETGRILGYNGVRNTIRAVPMMREIMKLAREGKLSNEVMDLGHFMHSTMTSNEFNPVWSMFDPDDYTEFSGGSFLDRMERRVDRLERFSFQASGFFHIDRFAKRLNAAATANKFVNDAVRGRPWNAKKLAALGLEPEDAERIFAAIRHEVGREGGAITLDKSTFGHRVATWNIDRFEDQAAAGLLGQAMNRYANRVVQTSTSGQKLLIQNDHVLKLMTQYLDFTIQGWEKHTLYAAQQFQDPGVYLATAWSTLFGSLVYMGQTHLNALGRGDKDEYLAEAGLGEDADQFRIFMAGLQRSGGLSILPQAVDFAGSATGLGTVFDARASGLSYAGDIPGIEANPTTAYFNNIKRALYGVGGALTGDDFSQQDARAVFHLWFLQNHLGVKQIQNSISSLLPPEER